MDQKKLKAQLRNINKMSRYTWIGDNCECINMYNNNLRLVFLLTVLVLAGACGDIGGGSKKSNSSNNSRVASNKTIQSYEWKQVKSMATNFKPTADKINHVAASKNSKYFYAIADDGNELFAADLSAKFSDISNDNKWASVGLDDSGLDGTAGQATLEAATMARALVPTELGVLVERDASAGNDDNGVGYLAGTTWTAAWSHEGTAHLASADLSQTRNQINAGLITKAGVEYPVLFSDYQNSGFFLGSTVAIGAAKANIVLDNNDNLFTSRPKLVMAGPNALLVNSYGVHTLLDASIDPTNLTWKTSENPVTERNTGNLGSDSWMFQGAVGQNSNVTSLAVAGNKLFIGLGSSGGENETGGVAVYDFVTPANSKAPAAAWDQYDVLALTVDPAGKVWAVSKKGLMLANPDGSQGGLMKTTTVPAYDSVVNNGNYDKTPLLPADNISDACFVGNNLVISTTDQGLIYRLAPVAVTVSP